MFELPFASTDLVMVADTRLLTLALFIPEPAKQKSALYGLRSYRGAHEETKCFFNTQHVGSTCEPQGSVINMEVKSESHSFNQ